MTNIFIAIAVTIVLALFFKVAKNAKTIKNADGDFVLRYSNMTKWFCMGLTIFATIGFTAILFDAPIKDDKDLIAVILMYGALMLFGTYFYIEFFTVEIIVSEHGIKGTSGWRGKREYRWDEIENISYSPASMWFKVTAPHSAPLRIHALISGIDNFLRLCIEKLPEEKWMKAHEQFVKDKRVSR